MGEIENRYKEKKDEEKRGDRDEMEDEEKREGDTTDMILREETETGTINITRDDLQRLEPEGVLNPELIEFRMGIFIHYPSMAPCNSLFFQKLLSQDKNYLKTALHWYTMKLGDFKYKHLEFV